MPRTASSYCNNSVTVGTRFGTFQCGVVRKHPEHSGVRGLELSGRM